MEQGIRMQIVGWDQKSVDADRAKHSNNRNINEMVVVKLCSSEDRCCICSHFCKAVPLTIMTVFELPLSEHAVSNLTPRFPANTLLCPPDLFMTCACKRQHGLVELRPYASRFRMHEDSRGSAWACWEGAGTQLTPRISLLLPCVVLSRQNWDSSDDSHPR